MIRGGCCCRKKKKKKRVVGHKPQDAPVPHAQLRVLFVSTLTRRAATVCLPTHAAPTLLCLRQHKRYTGRHLREVRFCNGLCEDLARVLGVVQGDYTPLCTNQASALTTRAASASCAIVSTEAALEASRAQLAPAPDLLLRARKERDECVAQPLHHLLLGQPARADTLAQRGNKLR